jgi:hypothetical protein
MSSCCKKTIACVLVSVVILAFLVVAIIGICTTTVFGGVQAQLDDAGGAVLANGSDVAFNTVINDQSTDITYNPVSGDFIITKPGNYLVSWWFATDGAGPATSVSFAVEVNGVPYSTASSPIVSGQLSGTALVTVTSTPTVITLVNVTGETVFIPTTPVQSGFVITEIVD